MKKGPCRVAAVWVVAALVLTAYPKTSAQTSPVAKPADYSQEPYVVERAFSKLVFQNDGKYTQENSLRVRIQSQAGLQAYGILRFSFASATSTSEIVYVRVTKPNGSVVQTPAENIVEMPADITRQAPFYSDLKEKQ